MLSTRGWGIAAVLVLCCALRAAAEPFVAPHGLMAQDAAPHILAPEMGFEPLPPIEFEALPDPLEPIVAPSPDAFVRLPSVTDCPLPDSLGVVSWTEAWDSRIEIGLNGSQGNNDNFNFRLGATAKRETERSITKADMKYQRGEANELLTQSLATGEVRQEWLSPPSPYSLFSQGSLVYDEFKAFDVRVQSYSGLGYYVMRTAEARLAGRMGAGMSQEIGGPEDQLIPEGVLGLEAERKVTKRHSLLAYADFFNDLTDVGDYRMQSKGVWEIAFDPEKTLTLKIEVTDQLDSTPAGKEKNDLNYAVLLLWKL